MENPPPPPTGTGETQPLALVGVVHQLEDDSLGVGCLQQVGRVVKDLGTMLVDLKQKFGELGSLRTEFARLHTKHKKICLVADSLFLNTVNLAEDIRIVLPQCLEIIKTKQPRVSALALLKPLLACATGIEKDLEKLNKKFKKFQASVNVTYNGMNSLADGAEKDLKDTTRSVVGSTVTIGVLIGAAYACATIASPVLTTSIALVFGLPTAAGAVAPSVKLAWGELRSLAEQSSDIAAAMSQAVAVIFEQQTKLQRFERLLQYALRPTYEIEGQIDVSALPFDFEECVFKILEDTVARVLVKWEKVQVAATEAVESFAKPLTDFRK